MCWRWKLIYVVAFACVVAQARQSTLQAYATKTAKEEVRAKKVKEMNKLIGKTKRIFGG